MDEPSPLRFIRLLCEGEMLSYQERVVSEKRELDERIFALMRFITEEGVNTVFESLPDGEKSRLRIQLSVMQAYGRVLGERIAHFS
jgi:hypothetical protein